MLQRLTAWHIKCSQINTRNDLGNLGMLGVRGLLLDTMAEDATWWIPGKTERSPSAGLYPKDRIGRLFGRMMGALESGLKMTVVSCIAEGDSVALEVVSAGDLKNGRKYRQEYHMLLKFRRGKIMSVREYLDTQHANDVWATPLTEQELEKVRAASQGDA